MSSSLGAFPQNCHRAQAFPHRGPLAGWAVPPRGPRGRDGALGRVALVGRRKRIRFSYFPENRNVYLFSVMSPTSINRSKLHGCPKIVKLSLLGSQKYHLPISTVSSVLAVRMVGS